MCGIVGIYDSNGQIAINEEVFDSMTDILQHRGPDARGVYFDKQIALGSRRLRVIDLKAGDQPIFNEDKSICVIHNGEIYNFKELKGFLVAKGHTFKTETDTEVIAHLYEEKGLGFVDDLRGMFALAIWDARNKSLVLAKDRMGQKPLFYAKYRDSFVFASEIKAILLHPGISREINMDAIDLFLSLLYIPTPMSIFKGIFKLPPGHLCVVNHDGVKIKRYWDLKYEECALRPEKYYIEKLRELITEVTKLRMISDVPIGSFLSGGIDSSTISACMSRLNTQKIKMFTIGFPNPRYDESLDAALVCKHINAEQYLEKINDIPHDLPEKLAWHFDEPYADSSAIPTYLVSKLAKRHVTVALSGDGGDELFGGYEHAVHERIYEVLISVPKALHSSLKWMLFAMKLLPLASSNRERTKDVLLMLDRLDIADSLRRTHYYPYFRMREKKLLYSLDCQYLANDLNISNYFEPYFNDRSKEKLRQLMYCDIKTYLLDDILVKNDRMSMANSLELRSPFLDHKLVEFAYQIPSNIKVKWFINKYILKKAVTHILPNAILAKRKQGFALQCGLFSQGKLSEKLRDCLSSASVMARGYFEIKYVNYLVEKYMSKCRKGENDMELQYLELRLWALMELELWHREYAARL